VRPRVGRIDRPGQGDQRGLHAHGVLLVRGGEERRPRTGARSLHQVPAHRPRLGDVGRLQREPELAGQLQVRRTERAHDLAAHLHGPAVVEHDPLDPPAGPVARLEHLDVGAARHEIAGRRQPGEPRAQHEHVPPRRHRRT
jgi:hypothetical protein